MDAKKNLTNAQRVMLDKLYTKQFALKRDEITATRNLEHVEMTKNAIKRFESQPEIANAIRLAAEFNEAKKLIDPTTLRRSGINVYLNDAKVEISLWVNSCYNNYGADVSVELPELTEFKARTKEINTKLDQAENEMRLRIHGSDLTYAEIEAEINEILKGVTL